MNFSILVAVCLFAMVSGNGLLTGLKRNIKLHMKHAGQGACDVANPCGDNGICEVDENGDAVCYCNSPYSGVTCDQVCEFDKCWEEYWEEMAAYTGQDDHHEEDEESCMNARHTMTSSPDHLRRALHMKRHGASSKNPGGERTYEQHCRKGISSLLKCFDEGLAEKSYCSACSNDTVSWVADVIQRRGNIADEYCSDSWECKDEETSQCVDKVSKMFEIRYGTSATEQVEANKAEIHYHLDEVEACIIKIVEGDLSLAGCIHNSWLKNEILLLSVEVIRAEVNGCNMTDLDVQCSVGTISEDMDEICALSVDEREKLVDESLQCAKEEATAQGSVCDGAVDKVVQFKPDLMKESAEECKRIAAIDGIIGSCDTQKPEEDLKLLLRALTKDDRRTLLEVLLRGLVSRRK